MVTTLYVTRDGKQFANKNEAEEYDSKLTLIEACYKLVNSIKDKYSEQISGEDKSSISVVECCLKQEIESWTNKK